MKDIDSKWSAFSYVHMVLLFAEITSSSSSAPRTVGSPCHQNESGLLSEKQMSRSSQREGRKISIRNFKSL